MRRRGRGEEGRGGGIRVCTEMNTQGADSETVSPLREGQGMGRCELAAILDNQDLHAQGEEQHSQEDGVGEEALEDVQFYSNKI